MCKAPRSRKKLGTVSSFRVLDKLGEDLPDAERKGSVRQCLAFCARRRRRSFVKAHPRAVVERFAVTKVILKQGLTIQSGQVDVGIVIPVLLWTGDRGLNSVDVRFPNYVGHIAEGNEI